MKINGMGVTGQNQYTYRVRKVAEMLRDGLSHSQIREWIYDNWDDAQDQRIANKWIDLGYEWIAPSPEEDIQTKEAARKHIEETLQSVIADARAKGHNKVMLAALDQLAKVQGLYKEKIEADVNTEISFEFGG